MLVISFVFYETNMALIKFYRENKNIKKEEEGYLLFKVMANHIPVEQIKK